MADLRTTLEKLPIQEIETYIQSGNIIFSSEHISKDVLAATIKKSIVESFGLDVPVIVKTIVEWERIVAVNPYTAPEDVAAKKIYYVLLKDAPLGHVVQNLDQTDYPNERFHITPQCIYLKCSNGAGKAKLNNNDIEKKLEVTATTRNHRTMMRLLHMARDKSA